MRKLTLIIICIAGSLCSYAQPSLTKLTESVSRQRQENLYSVKLSSATQGAVQFNPASKMMKMNIKAWLNSSLGMRAGKDVLEKTDGSTKYTDDLDVESYQQYYKGIKVEHGLINVISKAGKVAAIQLEFFPLEETLVITPRLTEVEALKKATAYIGASKYAWEGNAGKNPEWQKPSGSLVIVEDYYKKAGKLHLAYKFKIYAEQPLSHSYVYINALDGSVMLVDRIIKHLRPDIDEKVTNQKTVAAAINNRSGTVAKPIANTSGTAQTRYSGLQALFTDDGSSAEGKPFWLRQSRNGHNIVTLNYERRTQGTTNDAAAIDFTDNDNNWTTPEHAFHYDDAALDCHHAMQYISDYWKNVHNRDSWNNANGQMKSYVHVRGNANTGYDNAFWNGSAMYYGDGSYYSASGDGTISNANGFKPLTSLDVSAHELGHAITQATARLIYQRESGGINEGFSDIWAACVENYANLGKSPFLIGEEITPGGGALRSMINPKLYGSSDTYGGRFWRTTTLAGCAIPGSGNDNCGVHFNSGVLNKWFYLITQGGNATNDHGDVYAVSGLGFAKSEKIAYLTELSLTPNADYAAARVASINAATTLYGACSNEVIQVTNAWFAVGVGGTANCTPVVEFLKTTASVTEGNGLDGTCTGTKIVSVPVKLGSTATQQTEIQFSFGGTAQRDVHYTVASPVVLFNAGESGTKSLNITLLDNATIEGSKTITLSYIVNGNGGNGSPGLNNQDFTLTIIDDDALLLPIKAAAAKRDTLLKENFDALPTGTTFPSGWNGTLAFTGGGSATNKWVVGSKAGSGITGNAAYISKASETDLSYGYSISSTTDRLLRLPPFNTTGKRNIRLSFTYKVGGEAYPVSPSNTDATYWASLWDYGRVVYDSATAGRTPGTTFVTLYNTPVNDFFAFYDDGTTAKTFGSFMLPASMENKPVVYIGFRWTNDNADGDGIPWAIDDIMITADSAGSSVETNAATQPRSVRILEGQRETYIFSGSHNLLAKLDNISQPISCLSASLAQSGEGQTIIHTSSGSFLRSKKVVQLTPGTNAAGVMYKATFYFTEAELTGWSGAGINSLQFLKVKDGVDLNGIVGASDYEFVTPAVISSAGGVYSFTAEFTGFSQFMLVSATTPLPVNLLTFEAQPRKKNIELIWKTAKEYNNKGFEVERSVDGVNFTSVGWVKGAGTTAASNSYQYRDNFVQSNTTYHYRLKQVDVGNKVKYSLIRQARIAVTGVSVTVSPNPVKNMMRIFVVGSTEPVSMSLVSSKGQRVALWNGINAGAGYEVNVSRFSKGLYTLIVHLPDGELATQVLLE